MWAAIVIASLVALAVLALTIPVDFVFRADFGKPTVVRARTQWLFGLVSWEAGKPPARRKIRRKEKPRKGRPPRASDIKLILRLLRTRGLATQVRRFIRDCIKSFSVRSLRADLAIGLGDPAETGFLFAFVGPALAFANVCPRCDLALRASFEPEPSCEGEMEGIVRLWPVRIGGALLKFAFSPAVMRVAGRTVAETWRRRT